MSERERERERATMASTIDEGEELVPTSNVLYAAHKHIGERCKDVSTSFLKCKKKDLDPSVCLNEGKAVLGCLGTV